MTARLIQRAVFIGAAAFVACGGGESDEPGVELLAGDATVFDDTGEAFNYPARNLPAERRASFGKERTG